MKSLLKTFLLFIFFPMSLAAYDSPVRWTYEVSPRVVTIGGDATVDVLFSIPAGNYLYKDKMGLAPLAGVNARLKELVLPAGILKTDPVTGEQKEVYEGEVMIRAKIAVSPEILGDVQGLNLELSYQGCSEKLCFRMMRETFSVPLRAASLVSKAWVKGLESLK